MCSFKPGDEVVCIKSRFGVSSGRHFTVAAVLPAGVEPQGFYVRCQPSAIDLIQTEEMGWHQGMRNGRWFWGWDASCFRKVQRRDLTEWLATENTIDEPTRVPAMEPA